MLKRALIPAVLAVALLPGAAAARSRTLHYQGKTKEGPKISFDVDRKGWITHFTTSLTTTCVSAQGGTPRVTFTSWDIPYNYRLGAKVALDYGDPTYHYHLATTRGGGHRVTGRMSINYSLLRYSSGYYLEHCLATGNFSLKPKR